MRILLSSRGLFAFCFVILVATNITVLSGVSSNRNGEPDSQIILTERELQIPYQVYKENSGLSLRLTWRALGPVKEDNYYSNGSTPVWFDAEKLKELGFNINDYLRQNDSTTFYKQPILKEVFIVLEYDGEQYAEAVKRSKNGLAREEGLFNKNPDDKKLRDNLNRAKKRLKHEQITETRLFAIDAGVDPGKLRKKYGDRARFIIIKGLVKPRHKFYKNNKEVSGYISRLSVSSIYIPLKHRQVFDAIVTRDKSNRNDIRPPRFNVKLAYGKRLEPWMMSIKAMDDKSN